MGYVLSLETDVKEIEVRRPDKKKMRHIIPKNRKENHLIIMCRVEDEHSRNIVETEIKKMTKKLDHLLNDGMSFEFIIDKFLEF